ncbi:hypothetical protein CDL15_Pgr022678 [Punica granatum]|uniref:PWWP domain-containing protein n=1 Tax=Punica granatum TaxID=22663 RepID=A0A218XSD4_PUNGR|nr:hypothetical protein CDL15_Pgr022678 [Punica granatum]
MAETKHKDVSVGSGDTDGGKTLAGPMEVVLEGNNGEDIMVEVLGSDVFVDGVRSHEGEGDSAGEVGHGGPVDEAKPELEIDGNLQESGVPGDDLGVNSSERGEMVGGDGEDAILKEIRSTTGVDTQIGVTEIEEEDLIVQDTQLLDEDTQPVEESLAEEVSERNEVDGVSKVPVVEKGVEESVEAAKEKDGQLVDQSVNAVEQKTQETTVPDEEKSKVQSLHGEDNLNSKNGETHTNDVPEVGAEKVPVVDDVPDRGEAKDDVPVTNAVSAKEPDSVAVEGGVETTTMEGPSDPAVVTTDAAVPDATPSLAEDQKANGESLEAVTLVAGDAEMEHGKIVSNAGGDGAPKPEEEPADGETKDGKGMVDPNVGQEMETDREIVTDAEKVTSDGNENAVKEEPLKVESVTVVTESVTVVAEVAETVEKAVCDPNVEVPADYSAGETPIDMVCEGTQNDVEMTEASEGVLDSSVEVSEPADNNQNTVDESRDVEDKVAVVDTEMADLQEVGGAETDEEKNIKQGGAPKTEVQASYQLPPEKELEGEFSVSDLVWGKVRSHPWWPGQIFDTSDASEQAVKYQKKDSFLVAYFGDRTFAWNEANLLKPFRTHFSVAEKQGSSESFQNAVDCALEELSRRVELGLACSCTPKEALEKMKFQVVENTGIREESSKRECAGEYSKGSCFEPDKLMGYMKELAQFPCGGADRLELVIAKAQLLNFYRLKGYSHLPELVLTDGFSDEAENLQHEEENRILGEATDTAGSLSVEEEEEDSSGQEGSKPRSSLKRKHNLRESTYPYKKGRSMTELMGPATDEDDRRKSISVAKVTNTATQPATAPKPSFKIGECIKRIASQLTGSPLVKSKNESDPSQSTEDSEKGAGVASEYSSMEDLLSQLQVAAQEPMLEHSFSNVIACFFSDFRNSVVLDQNPELGKSGGGGKRKRLAHLDGFSEAFEFEDMNDSYWTDRVIENGADEEPHSDGGGRRVEHQLVPVDSGKPHKTGRRPYKRRLQETNHEMQPEKPPGYIDANAPAELVIAFPEYGYLPSEANLSRMFKRFGPIRESETEVDRETSRARVVFKKCSDAEVACSSARRFKIFGPIHVTYQLNYSVSETFRSSGLAMMEVPEEDGF